ncbi:MAG TPA: CheR family methyltransferase [Kofleriaceae bacterium]
MAGELTPQLLAIFSHLVEEACGVHYGPVERELFETKLVAQAADAGFESLLDYYYRLRYDDPTGTELRALVQALVVHETYFFRELPPLDQLVRGHLADTVRAKGRARVWSAACSTGEEPYTLAILLADAGLLDRVEIIASDISAAAIARARSGEHGRRALRDGHPEHLAAKYLERGPRGVSVVPRIAAAVDFRVVNLVDDAAVRALGTFDAVLLRNALIYFRDARIAQVLALIDAALAPGGVLAVGVSESLMRFGTSLRCEERGGAFFYRSAR